MPSGSCKSTGAGKTIGKVGPVPPWGCKPGNKTFHIELKLMDYGGWMVFCQEWKHCSYTVTPQSRVREIISEIQAEFENELPDL